MNYEAEHHLTLKTSTSDLITNTNLYLRNSSSNLLKEFSIDEGTAMSCLLPQYHIFTWILAMMSLASFIKLNYIPKLAMLFIMVLIYITLMLTAFSNAFSENQVYTRS